MTPVPETDRLAALSRLSGSGALTMPEPGPQRAVLALELVGLARSHGATWARIGEALGVPGGPKAAKAEAKRLARTVAAGKPWAVPGG